MVAPDDDGADARSWRPVSPIRPFCGAIVLTVGNAEHSAHEPAAPLTRPAVGTEPPHLDNFQVMMVHFRDAVRNGAVVDDDLLVTMMMLVMQMRRRRRRCSCREQDRKQQRRENGSHDSPPRTRSGATRVRLVFPLASAPSFPRGDDGPQAPSSGPLWVRTAYLKLQRSGGVLLEQDVPLCGEPFVMVNA